MTLDAAERALLETTVADALADVAAGDSAAVDAMLATIGWREMLDAEPSDAIDIVFTALGATNATGTVLDDVLLSALGHEPRDDLSVVLPEFGRWDTPGVVAGGRITASGLAGARAASATELLVVATRSGEWCTVTVPRASATLTPVHGIDPNASMHTVRLDHDATAARGLAPDAWDEAVARARRACGHQISGATRTMLELARTHALERVQFGRPIARFQAVRHRLAEALVAIEALDAALGAAADEPNDMTAALAKALAGRAARTVAGHCQQVLAGIGFTTEHAFHHFLKRTMLLEGLFGSTDEIVLAIGRELLATRSVPTLVEL